jgi:hypothetical protein
MPRTQAANRAAKAAAETVPKWCQRPRAAPHRRWYFATKPPPFLWYFTRADASLPYYQFS